MVETVKFNVGGKHFEVSRALIVEHPDTMLAKLISKAWENESDKDKPIFIDRDGDKFSYVLDYLRYGSIELPQSIPKTMLQRELDYYGIAVADGTVKSMSFIECVQTNNAKFEYHKLAKDMLDLALKCNIRLLQAVGTGNESVTFDVRKEEYSLYDSYRQQNGQKLLNKYLDEFFGLTVMRDKYEVKVSIKK
jgi:hypothetical protein